MTRRTIARWIIGLAAAAVGISALVGIQAVGRHLVTRYLTPTGGARWIWREAAQDRHRPTAFYAVRDFELTAEPSSAELLTLADEESVIFLNGVPIAARRYFDGSPVTSFDVARILRAGNNRLLAELRSTRGVGGLLLRLTITDPVHGSGEVLSDSSWRIFRRSPAKLFDLDSRLADGEAPRVWGQPPTGRWSIPRRPMARPTIEESRTTGDALGAERYRLNDRSTDWQPAGPANRFSPILGSRVTFDWGREVFGCLALRFPPGPRSGQEDLGMIFVGPDEPTAGEVEPDSFVVAMADQRVWLDVVPRRFRFVTYVGLRDLSGAEVYPIDAGKARLLADADPPPRGPFGVRASRLGTPLENEIWGKLHGFPGVALREER